ncbi:hypothetical protein VTK56DRAFT_1052 [Thermocarpiscus australiensis]
MVLRDNLGQFPCRVLVHHFTSSSSSPATPDRVNPTHPIPPHLVSYEIPQRISTFHRVQSTFTHNTPLTLPSHGIQSPNNINHPRHPPFCCAVPAHLQLLRLKGPQLSPVPSGLQVSPSLLAFTSAASPLQNGVAAKQKIHSLQTASAQRTGSIINKIYHPARVIIACRMARSAT